MVGIANGMGVGVVCGPEWAWVHLMHFWVACSWPHACLELPTPKNEHPIHMAILVCTHGGCRPSTMMDAKHWWGLVVPLVVATKCGHGW